MKQQVSHFCFPRLLCNPSSNNSQVGSGIEWLIEGMAITDAHLLVNVIIEFQFCIALLSVSMGEPLFPCYPIIVLANGTICLHGKFCEGLHTLHLKYDCNCEQKIIFHLFV